VCYNNVVPKTHRFRDIRLNYTAVTILALLDPGGIVIDGGRSIEARMVEYRGRRAKY